MINLLYLFLHMEAIERPDDPAAISDEKVQLMIGSSKMHSTHREMLFANIIKAFLMATRDKAS